MATRLDGGTALDLSGCAKNTRAWLGSLTNDLIRAGTPGIAVKNALAALAEAIEALTAAKADATRIAGDPRYTSQHKVDAIKKLVGSAFDDVMSAAEALGSAIDSARDKITASIMPARPAGADNAMLAFKAQEVAKALEGAGDPIKAASSLLADALASDDKELVYVLCGGPMSITYRRLVANQSALAVELARVLDAAKALPTTGAAALLPVLSAGGSGTLRSLVNGAQTAVRHEREGYNDWLVRSARAGTMTGIWENPVTGKSRI